MLVFAGEVDINTNIVNDLDVDLLETFCQPGLIDLLLHRIEVQCENLVLSCDRTPEVEKFAKWVLLEPSEGDSLLVRLLDVLVHTLAVVRHREKLRYLSAAPDRQNFLADDWFGSLLAPGVDLVLRHDLVLELTSDALKAAFQASSLQTIGSNSDQVH